MDYCAPRGIPHSVFLTWSEDDQDKAIGWTLDQRKKCGQCGSYPDDWMDPETKIPHHPPPMFAHSFTCMGCVTIEREAEEARKALKDSPQLAGVRFYLDPVPPVVEFDDEDWDEDEDIVT